MFLLATKTPISRFTMIWILFLKIVQRLQSSILMSANGTDLFISNITEDVFHVLQETFNLDYTRQLNFQVISEQQELQSSHSNVTFIPASATDDTLKGSFHSSIPPLLMNS